MLEFLLVPLTATGVVLVKGLWGERMNDRKKIGKVFARTKCMVADFDKQGRGYKKLPVLLKKRELENGTLYVYRLPIGLPKDAVLIRKEVIEEALGKKIDIETDHNIVRIFAFNDDLPTEINLNATEGLPHKEENDESSVRCKFEGGSGS